MYYYQSLLSNEHIQYVPPNFSDSHNLKCATVSDAKGQWLPFLLLAHTERWEDRVGQVIYKPCFGS